MAEAAALSMLPFSAGSMATFNINDGSLEGLLRGFRHGFLTDADYHHLQQCEKIDDVKLNLQETEYGQFMRDYTAKVTPKAIINYMRDKLVSEVEYLRCLAAEPLATFMDYISYEYMIENVISILQVVSEGEASDEVIKKALEQMNPLGKFSDSTVKSLTAFAGTGGFDELYSTVLIDTPIGKYFAEYLRMQNDKGSSKVSTQMMTSVIQDTSIERMKTLLTRFYLEDFYQFCEGIGGETAAIMCPILRAKADAMVLAVTLNSFGTDLNQPNARQSDRAALYPAIGNLYPEAHPLIARVGDENGLVDSLKHFKTLQRMMTDVTTGNVSLTDVVFVQQVEMCELAFEGQFHYGMFYAYVTLKEQELRNVGWIAECVLQGQKQLMEENFVPIFSPGSPWRNRPTGGRGN